MFCTANFSVWQRAPAATTVTSLSTDPGAVNSRTGGESQSLSRQDVDISNDFALTTSLSARTELFVNFRLGQATARDLLPENILSRSLRSFDDFANTQEPTDSKDVDAAGASGFLARAFDGTAFTAIGSDSTRDTAEHDRTEGSGKGRGASTGVGRAQSQHAPAGMLHQFIKHVKPFSLCLEGSTPEESSGATRPQATASTGHTSLNYFRDGGDLEENILEQKNVGFRPSDGTSRCHGIKDPDMLSPAHKVSANGSDVEEDTFQEPARDGVDDVSRKPRGPIGMGERVGQTRTSLPLCKRKLVYSSPPLPRGDGESRSPAAADTPNNSARNSEREGSSTSVGTRERQGASLLSRLVKEVPSASWFIADLADARRVRLHSHTNHSDGGT